MKMTKKIVALVSALAITASFAVSVSAADLALGQATATASVDTVAAGESVTIYGGWDTLLNSENVQLTIKFDETAFTVDEGDNTTYNFAKFPKKSYLPKFVDEVYVSARHDYEMGEGTFPVGTNVTCFLPITAALNAATKDVVYMFADTSGSTVLNEDYASLDITPNIGTVFTANDDIKPGDYEFTVEVVSAAGTTGRVAKTASVKVTVEGDEPEVTLVAGVDSITTEGKHYGKASFSASTGVATTGLAKITVENDEAAGRVDEWEAPATFGDGITKVLPIVTYDKDAWAGSTFTVKFLNALGEAIKTLTYKVAE